MLRLNKPARQNGPGKKQEDIHENDFYHSAHNPFTTKRYGNPVNRLRFIRFYCNHCKSKENIIRKAGEKMKTVPTITGEKITLRK